MRQPDPVAFFLVMTSGALAAVIAAPARAQFADVIPATDIVEQLEGQLLGALGAPTPQPGDQVAAFAGDQILGVFTFVSTQTDPLAWDMIIFGDDPDTANVKEGPAAGEVVTFQFFDVSTNTTRLDLAPVSKATSEVITVGFEGALTFQFPFNISGAPPFPGPPGPNIPFDLKLGVNAPTPSPGTPTTGGASGPTGPSLDVNGDGKVDKLDAAVVLRLVAGASRVVTEAQAAAADVNGDGVVDIQDAIAIIRNRPFTPS